MIMTLQMGKWAQFWAWRRTEKSGSSSKRARRAYPRVISFPDSNEIFVPARTTSAATGPAIEDILWSLADGNPGKDFKSDAVNHTRTTEKCAYPKGMVLWVLRWELRVRAVVKRARCRSLETKDKPVAQGWLQSL